LFINTRTAVILISLLFIQGSISSRVSSAKEGSTHQVASLQFFHPLATNTNPDASSHLRIGLLYARSGKIRGCDFTLLAGKTSGTMRGLQYTGFYSEVGGEFVGLSLTGGLHYLKEDGTGLQISGLSNYSDGMFAGFQYAGILNYTTTGMFGAQFSGLLNINAGWGAYLQMAGVANINRKGFSGAQVSLVVNQAKSEIVGTQLALMNFAEDMRGVQVGALNVSRQFEGLQVGLVNFNRHFEGASIGLVNLATGSRREWVFSGGATTSALAGFRTVVNHWSSIVSAGWGDQQSDVSDNFLLGWHFGRCFPIGTHWSLTTSLGYQHVLRTTSKNANDNTNSHFNLQARLTCERRVSKNVGIFVASGLSTAFSKYSRHANSSTHPLAMGGISIGLDH